MSGRREFDLVLFGATGYTGRLTAGYLAEKAGEEFRWAIAGRDAGKLEALAAELGGGPGVIRADVTDYDSLLQMARRARVLVTTVGPYIRYGEAVVMACVEAGTHYADLTGEPAFVDRVIDHCGTSAREQQVRVVNCCGFDSIPHDLGAWMMVRALPDDAHVQLEGIVSAKGGISGGTWNSALEALGNLGETRRVAARMEQGLSGDRRVKVDPRGVHYEKQVAGWVMPFPTIDRQIIIRSASSLPEYGREFTYAHYLRAGSLANLAALSTGIGTVAGLAQVGPVRRWLGGLKPPGSGPDEETRRTGRFRITFIARADGRRLIGEVSGGEPGYAETSRMLAEAGLCLALDERSLPKRYGVLTPAEAMGDALLERLRGIGIRFEIVSDESDAG
jgi:short subunit dehydrogenase-like uncharacterized protein